MKIEFDESKDDEAIEEVNFVEFLKSLLLEPFKKKSADDQKEGEV